LMKFESAPNDLFQILDFFSSIPINKSIWSIMQRLVLGAIVYIIWQERNLRLFQGKARNVDVVCKIIKDLIRFRILGLKVKSSFQALKAADIWDFSVLNGSKDANGK
ncbi:hypothetical protein Tco_1299511, partial [Tanacetum coccineum]